MTQPTFEIPETITDEADAERWFYKASKLEKRHEWLAAIAIFDELSRLLAGTANGTYATNCAQKLRGYIAAGGIPADAPRTAPPPETLGFLPFSQAKIRMLIIGLFAAVFAYVVGFARGFSGAIAIAIVGLGASLFWFTFSIVWGRGLTFNGFALSVIPIGDGASPFGDYMIIMWLPIRGFKAFLRTVHARWALAIPWYCCWFCALSSIGSIAINAC